MGGGGCQIKEILSIIWHVTNIHSIAKTGEGRKLWPRRSVTSSFETQTKLALCVIYTEMGRSNDPSRNRNS